VSNNNTAIYDLLTPLPPGYSVNITTAQMVYTTNYSALDQNIQKITVVILQNSIPIVTLEGYKVKR